MTAIGIHASHEQHPPSRLLRYVRDASARGIGYAMCSDHFAPWSDRQGESGYAWSWLGSALASTDMDIGVFTSPIMRQHPAIVAQAAATLAEMFPGRFWLAAGTGEFLNEHVTGQLWPPKSYRVDMLRESVDCMRRLWNGETVTHEGRMRMRDAKVYSRPAVPPPVYGGAISEETAAWAGAWADGLITVGSEKDALAANVTAFRRGGGCEKPVFLQSVLCYAKTDEEALAIAHDQWRQALLEPRLLAELATPGQFDEATASITREEVAKSIRASSSIEQHIAWIKQDMELGFDRIYLHQLGDLDLFLDALTEKMLPKLA
jgi:coenzyme F420-dependent glucose-6-phosphate dehydrogenase